MSITRPNIQLSLAFETESKSEAPRVGSQGTEILVASGETESPAKSHSTMEYVLARENLREALRRVRKNQGSPGIDGMTVDELSDYLREHWPTIREQLRTGTYQPQPVRQVEIPKPGGGMRLLGIPTVLDRFIQQAVLQVLQPAIDPTFSAYSYGFRPGRSAPQAVAQAQSYVAQGYGVVVDIDLEKFFDRVNHDMLMGRVARRVEDQQILQLIRTYLNAGIMDEGLTQPRDEGVPQGSPLSPLLSNIFLDDWDQELERRGHRFARFADDCNIHVRSRRAGERVMESITRFLEKKLKLRVNREKSAVGRPQGRKFLGFRFVGGNNPKRGLAPETLKRFKARVKELTCRRKSMKLETRIAELAKYLRGWRNYYGFCETPSVLRDLDAWIRRRLRCVVWKQWKRGRKRFAALRQQGISRDLAAQTAGSTKGPWHVSRSPALNIALSNAYFERLGLPSLASS